MPPTVLVNPPDNLTVMQQEIFGPLLPVITYEGLEQALGFVLARDKPLAFYLFDRESARVDAVRMVHIYDAILWQVPTLQEGGGSNQADAHLARIRHPHCAFEAFRRRPIQKGF